ncbi:MAG: hypothetical protein ACJ76J_16005 [Thermoanaerobaculia bacterium]
MSAALEDYKLKLGYLTSQFDRLWTRFNFFLSIETALFGFLGYLIFEVKNVRAVPFVGVIGVVLSTLWYIIGAQDQALVRSYRERVDDAAHYLSETDPGWPKGKHAASEVETHWSNMLSWYWRKLSITHLPVISSLLLACVWLLIVVIGFYGQSWVEWLIQV